MNKNSKLKKNIISGFLGQLITIILGIIVPRIFITSYGSDVNGLLGTISQIFTYMALLESGIGQAARNALYKPFQEKDIDGICTVATLATSYYRRFTLVYATGVILLAAFLPEFVKTNDDSKTIFFIVLLEGMSGVLSFYFIQTPSVILSVDGRNYINNEINLLNKFLTYFVKIVMASFGCSIVLLEIAYFILNTARVCFYKIYFSKNYFWIERKKLDKKLKLKDRNSYILTEIAGTVFNSTDMIILSMFVSTQLASVYSVYNMIYANLNLLMNTVYLSVVYILGRSYHSNIKKYAIVHDAFTTVFLGMMTALMSVCYILTIPFVSLYTRGIADVNYLYDKLPLCFSLVQIISWSRYISGNLTGIAGYAKQTSYVSIIEAVLNVVFSLLFVQKYGIVGALFGTVIALPLKVIWCIYISDKKVMKRSIAKSVRILGINYVLFAGVVFVSNMYPVHITSYLQFFAIAIAVTLGVGVIGILLNLWVNRDCWKIVKRYILSK